MKKFSLFVLFIVCAMGFGQNKASLLGENSSVITTTLKKKPVFQSIGSIRERSLTPSNDMIANSIDLDEIGFPYIDQAVETELATIEAGSPVNCNNAGGTPGQLFYSLFGVVPNSQIYIGTFGLDVWDVELTFATDYIRLVGQAGIPTKYWIGVSIVSTDGTDAFWENSTAGLVGYGQAYDDGTGSGFVVDNTLEGVYTFTGECTTIGGSSGTVCATNGLSNAFENGASFDVNFERIVAHDITVAADSDLLLERINLNAIIGANNSGANAGFANIYIYEDAEARRGVWYNFVPTANGTATTSIVSPAGLSSVTFYTAPNETSIEPDLTLVDWPENQCVSSTTATIPTELGQAYYVYVVNDGGPTDITINTTNLGTVDNTIEGFSYYPNPAKNALNLSAAEKIKSVAIFNLLGQRVINQDIDATTSEINVSNLKTGTYLMKVFVKGQIGTYRILKE